MKKKSKKDKLTVYQKAILETLAGANTWLTTNTISERIDIHWKTALENLIKLKRKRWVFNRKIDSIKNEWHFNRAKLKNYKK